MLADELLSTAPLNQDGAPRDVCGLYGWDGSVIFLSYILTVLLARASRTVESLRRFLSRKARRTVRKATGRGLRQRIGSIASALLDRVLAVLLRALAEGRYDDRQAGK
jgi:hypothetical protein